MSITLYGIPNCDTVKKARKFLSTHEVEYHFHNYKTDGADLKTLQGWIDELGWETVLNKRGTTWRKLDDSTKASTDATTAAQLLIDNPSMIKRPILSLDDKLVVGFSEPEWKTVLNI